MAGSDVTLLEELTVYACGTSRGNPGQAAGAWVVLDGAGKTLTKGFKRIGTRTANEAHYFAVAAGLKKALQIGAGKLIVRNSSEVVINQLNGTNRLKAKNLRVIMDLTVGMAEAHGGVTFEWVGRNEPGIIRAANLCSAAFD